MQTVRRSGKVSSELAERCNAETDLDARQAGLERLVQPIELDHRPHQRMGIVREEKVGEEGRYFGASVGG